MIITEHCNAFSHSLVRNLRVTRPPFNSTLASFDALPLQRSTYEAHKLELVVVVSGPECKKKPRSDRMTGRNCSWGAVEVGRHAARRKGKDVAPQFNRGYQ